MGVEEPGYVQIFGTSSGLPILEKKGDSSAGSPVHALPVTPKTVHAANATGETPTHSVMEAETTAATQDPLLEEPQQHDQTFPFRVAFPTGSGGKKLGIETSTYPSDSFLRISKLKTAGLFVDWNASR